MKGIRWIVCLFLVCALLPTQASAEGVTIEVCFSQPGWKDWFPQLVERYVQSHDGVDAINITQVSVQSYWSLMEMKLATGLMPDLMEIDEPYRLQQWKSHLLPLAASDADPDMLAAYQVDGTQYALPDGRYGQGVLYNMALLEEVGVTRLPGTPEEFGQLCQQLQDAGIAPLMVSYRDSSHWVAAAAALGVETGNWQGVLDFLSLSLRYGTGRSLAVDTDTAQGYFLLGRYAMLLFGDSGILMDKRCGAHVQLEDIQLGGFPVTNGGSLLASRTVGFGVVNTSEHPRETEDFLQWLVSDEEALAYQKEFMGLLPAKASAGTDRLSELASALEQASAVDATGSDDTQRLLHETENDWILFVDGKETDEQLASLCTNFLAGETGQP